MSCTGIEVTADTGLKCGCSGKDKSSTCLLRYAFQSAKEAVEELAAVTAPAQSAALSIALNTAL